MKADMSRRLDRLEVQTRGVIVQDLSGLTAAEAEVQIAEWQRSGRYREGVDLLVQLRRFSHRLCKVCG